MRVHATVLRAGVRARVLATELLHEFRVVPDNAVAALDLGLARGNPLRRLLVDSKGLLELLVAAHHGLPRRRYPAVSTIGARPTVRDRVFGVPIPQSRRRPHLRVRIVVMDEKTEGQLRVIRKVVAALQAADVSAWLFGGWGLDARIGRITREHGDVEFWVERQRALLRSSGAPFGHLARGSGRSFSPPPHPARMRLPTVAGSTRLANHHAFTS